MQKKMTALVIMDGFGLSPVRDGNAIRMQGTPHIDGLMDTYPHTRLNASGLAVGLPDGQMGNSEVGHLNMGAGRIVYQELTRISLEIDNGAFFRKEPLVWAMTQASLNGGALHLMGLLSDGGVHSHNTHLYALLKMAKAFGLSKVFVHCFLDGRDVPPTSGEAFIRELETEMHKIGVGEVATVMGRYWAMDRDNLWDRVNRAYNAMVLGEGQKDSEAAQAVARSYAAGITDEFVKPTVILKDGLPAAVIAQNDSVIFFNFRPDRARQLTRSFIQPDFSGFPRGKGFFHVNFVSMTQYDETFTGLRVVNPPENLHHTLGEVLSSLAMTQLRIAETQKYAHVTFFFNGGVEKAGSGEDRVLIPSSKVATFDLKPEMSAYEVTDEAIRLINEMKYDVMILNFANCDMVGHTGVMEAAMKAVETVDMCVGRVVEAVLDRGGRVFVTADHGNADQMTDPDTGGPFTAHTTNPVPFIVCDKALANVKLRQNGCLADIAPTMLDSMGLSVPADMTGRSLIVR
jgi:2,3-bisphosphoglycerate-independent phosphoglycerate mutase